MKSNFDEKVIKISEIPNKTITSSVASASVEKTMGQDTKQKQQRKYTVIGSLALQSLLYSLAPSPPDMSSLCGNDFT